MKPFAYLFSLVIFFCSFVACSSTEQTESIKLQVHAIQGDPGRGPVVVYLTNEKAHKYLTMLIDGDQATSIFMATSGQKPIRPLTHDLFTSLLDTLEIELKKIVITDLQNDIYYADLVVKQGENEINLDCRPSDAIALAIRKSVPIWGNPDILKNITVDDEFLGLKLQELTSNLRDIFQTEHGLLISEIIDTRNTENLDIQVGDIITHIEGEAVSALDQLAPFIQDSTKDIFEVTVIREGKEWTMELKNMR